jgi:peptide/nickel transport system substrate-binding protein
MGSNSRQSRRCRAAVAVGTAIASGLLVAVAATSGASVTAHASLIFRQGELPSDPVTNIFPFNNCSQFSVTNTVDFQDLLYRPLYWYGKGASLAVQPALSIGHGPVYAAPSGGGFKQVSITLKHWRYSNGEHVTAQSVAFFLNLWDAESANFCGSVPGDGIPFDVAHVLMPLGLGGNEIVIEFSGPVNPTWMTADFLASIVPFPKAWDRASLTGAPGSGDCGKGAWGAASTIAACGHVFTLLTTQALHPSTYAGSPLWKVVDGPYRVKSALNTGSAALVPNPTYSGPVHSKLNEVELLSYATMPAEQAALAAHSLQAGAVAATALGPAPSVGTPGSNLVPGIVGAYTPKWDPSWEFDFAAYNFTGADPKIAAIDEPFVRQALQEAVDQPAIIAAVDHGYSTTTCSPIPFAEGTPNPCPSSYSPSGAKALLEANGFVYDSDFRDWTCLTVSGCGPNLPQGYQLKFSLVYLQGNPTLASEIADEVAYWSALGIPVTATAAPDSTVVLGCTGSTYSMCDYIGWVYSPAFYPTGELIFRTGAQGNYGDYSNSTMDTLLDATTSGGATSLGTYASFAGSQDPVFWQPSPVLTSELRMTCVGALAPNAFGDFMPEYISHC